MSFTRLRFSIPANLHRIGLCTLTLLVLSQHSSAQQPADARDELQNLQQAAQAAQDRVDDLDDETRSMVSSYNRELLRYEELLVYNDNMRQLLASQAEERNRIDAELLEIEVVRQAIVPLMVEMVETLDNFIALDQPMLVEERRARIEQLQSIITRADVDIAEKYRRIIESYQIEAEYGQSLEAYESEILIDGAERTVDILRVGRVALYYIALDRSEAGIWNPETQSWTLLGEDQLDSLDFALRVAREQAPPNLMALPLWTQGGSE